MARVNVEEKAITDPRFHRLGMSLGAPPEYAQAVGLFAMLRVWKECIERGVYTLPGWVLESLLNRPDAPSLITGSDLAVLTRNSRFRIRGTRGRIEYLEEMRRNGRTFGHLGAEHGKKGGRPRKPPRGVSENPGNGIVDPVSKNPLQALAPALAQKTEEDSSSPVLDGPPTVDQVRAYVERRTVQIDPEEFVDHYAGNGWRRSNGLPIGDWRALVRSWERRKENKRPDVERRRPASGGSHAKRPIAGEFDPERHRPGVESLPDSRPG